jgi:hypothetical protein
MQIGRRRSCGNLPLSRLALVHVPDVMNAYQNWISKRMALLSEDGQKLMQHSQKAFDTTLKILSNGKGDLSI